MRNAVGVSAAPRLKNGLGVRLLSSSPVLVAREDPLGPTIECTFVIHTFVEIFIEDITLSL